jgi:hypothetical protein
MIITRFTWWSKSRVKTSNTPRVMGSWSLSSVRWFHQLLRGCSRNMWQRKPRAGRLISFRSLKTSYVRETTVFCNIRLEIYFLLSSTSWKPEFFSWTNDRETSTE